MQAAVEEGIVAGGGTTLLKLAQKIESIASKLDNDEQKIGAEIVRKALSYPLKLIANNAGVNGSVVVQKVRNYYLKVISRLGHKQKPLRESKL